MAQKRGNIGPYAHISRFPLLRLDECVGNIMKSVGRFHVVAMPTLHFLTFLWERFKSLRPKPTQYDAVEMVEVEENSET